MQDGDKHPDTTLPSFVKRAVVAQAIVIIVLVWGYATWRIRSDEAEVLDNARHELGAVAAGMYVHMQAVLNDSLGAARPLPVPSTVAAVSTTITPAQATELLSRELSERRLRAGAVRRRRGPLPQRGAGRPGPIARRLAAVARSHGAAPAQRLHRAAHRRSDRKLAARHSDRRAHCAARRRDRVGRRAARRRSARPVVREHGDPRRLVEPDLDARRSVAACAACSRRRARDQRRGDAAVPQGRRSVARGRLRRGTESDRRRHVAVRVPQSQRLSARGRRGARQARDHAAVARSHAQSRLCAGRRLRCCSSR